MDFHSFSYFQKHTQTLDKGKIISIKCLTIYFADNMAFEGQIKMNEMLRRLNLPLICRRKVQGGGNCFYDREELIKACVTPVLHMLQIIMVV